jgi:hypothetical protein
MASTYSMGFHFQQGVKVGHDISYPNNVGGQITLSFVSAKDKKRIIEEIAACGVERDKITSVRVTF